MKKFHFPLQRLLEIRKKKEDQQKLVLAKASGEYQLEINRKQQFFDNVKNERQRLSKNKKFDLDALRAYDQMDLAAVEASYAMETIIEEKKKRMMQEMDLYVALKKDRRAVELLREKAFKNYKEEEQRVEQQESNEIAKNVYLRNQANSFDSDNENKN